jgi:hypothetical protein
MWGGRLPGEGSAGGSCGSSSEDESDAKDLAPHGRRINLQLHRLNELYAPRAAWPRLHDIAYQ